MYKLSGRAHSVFLPQIFSLGLLLLFCLLFAGQPSYASSGSSFSYTSEPFEETTLSLENPYRGFYQIHAYELNDGNSSLGAAIQKQIASDEGLTLVLLEINLQNYAECAISESALSQIDSILTAWSASGKQIILRFLYDWDGNGLESEPSSLEQVLEHMEQVTAIVNRYADSIHILQGIFVGNYGEMNNSAYLSASDMTTLLTTLADLTDPSIYLAVRTPAQWRTVTGLFSLPKTFLAFDGSLLSRLGLYNDGILGSETDLSTYGSTSRAGSSDLSDKGTREEELTFQEELCRYVPNGGEVVYDYTQGDLEAAIDALSQMHISYLNAGYDESVLDTWKEITYTGDDVFYGCSGYDYISTHLGYRYILTASGMETGRQTAGEATLCFTIQNTGFASSTRAFDATVTLRMSASADSDDAAAESDETEASSETSSGDALPSTDEEPSDSRETDTLTYTATIDLRALSTGESTIGTAIIPVGELVDGTYTVYLTLTDAVTGTEIALASSPEATAYGYPLGMLTIGNE
ncbi:MAG: DUF4874 domain-containing protein [Lachnospiraceae bacterium]|nr:DUF4874 domain-containing protein [Lachnospiraceae bacterium]